MKKYIFVIVITLLCFTTTGCFSKEKEVKTAKEFTSIAKDLGFYTKDITKEQSEEQQKMLKSVTAAVKDDLQIEFYVFKNEKIAKTAFFNGEKLFDSKVETNYVDNIDHGKNYGYFYVDIKSRYGVVSRVENTLLLVDTTRKYKKDVSKLEKEMGY